MWQYVGNAGFSSKGILYPNLTFSPSDFLPYVAFADATNGKATLMKFDGSNWINVGNPGFSASLAYYLSLSFSPSDGQPYVAYGDYSDSLKATVMKFDGTNWVNVGTAGFSNGRADYTSLAISPSGQPYVAYQDWANSDKATVMKFDGTNWVNVGNAGFSAGEADHINLAFSSSGQPYVAYRDYGNNYGATVMMFDGTNWVNVGNADFTAGGAAPSLAFSPTDGEPYVGFYQDYGVSVMKFDGTSWVYVGNPGFSVWSEYIYVSLAFNSSGQPFVVYEDIQWLKAIVMKFDGINWVYVGPSDGFSNGGSYFTSIALSPSDDNPYVVFADGGDSLKATVMKYDSVFAGIKTPQHSQISLYPNPASDKITIETSANPTIPIAIGSQLSIMNVNGQQLITHQITMHKTQIDISNLPSGVYFVRLTGDRTVEVGKITKQ